MSEPPLTQTEPLPAIIESPPEKLASDLCFTEGPVWMPDGFLLFSDIPAGIIYKWSETGGLEEYINPSGNSNGLALDPQGRLVVCQQAERRIIRYEPGGAITPIAERWDGKRFNSPNDVVVRSDGTVYFSDPPYFIKDEDREIDDQAFYLARPSGEVVKVAGGYDRPNGLCFSPGESLLYVNDTPARIIDVYDVQSDGTLASKRRFADLASDEKRGDPDGMKVDVEGNVYCTGPGAIWIFRSDGSVLGRAVIPEIAANMAFGGADRKTLFITARTGLYRLRTKVPGV